MFDIISPDLLTGPSTSAAEGISIVNECLNKFANLGQYYEIHISHSRSTFIVRRLSSSISSYSVVFEIALDRIPVEHHTAATETLNQTKPSQAQKRLLLLRKGIARNTVDELEILSEIGQWQSLFRL